MTTRGLIRVRRRVEPQAGFGRFFALMSRRSYDNRDQRLSTSGVLELFAHPFLD